MLLLVVVVFGCCGVAVAEGSTCYPPGGVAGIVVATVIVTLVVAGLGAGVAWKYWWVPRQKNEGRNNKNGGPRRPDSQHQQKNPSDFAFDNPYFRNNQEGEDQVDSGRNKTGLNNKSSLRSSKQLSEASAKAKKARGGKNPFGFGGSKKKAQDDSCIAAVEPERAFVSLRGHDFTGLGFNICGNMRDGILVKDVLHRGPASESGLIKAGDKIVNVTVSFTSIVYEDALTILSYASPYDVQLEIERIPAAAAPKRLASCSFNNSGQKLFHPLYRSQSIDDLTQIDGGGSSGGTFPSHGAGPRRSHSVGVAAHKLAAHFKGREGAEEGGPSSLVLSATGSLNEKMLANVMTDSRGLLQWEKRFEDTLDSDQDTPKDSSSSIGKKESSKKSSYLDYPHSKLQQEMRTSESPRNRRLEGSLRKTIVEVPSRDQDRVSTTRDQDQTRISIRDEPTRDQGRSKTRKGVLKRDEENDSDVSRDSLEVSQRGYAKRNTKLGSSVTNYEVEVSDSPRKMFLQKTRELDDSKSSIYVKERPSVKSSRTHSNSLSSNEESIQDIASTSYSKTRQDSSNLKSSTTIFSTSPYGERQKTSSSEGFGSSYVERQNSEGFGVNKIVINGGVSDDCKRSVVVQPRTSEDSSQTAKFAKKTAPAAGGMFTQINPFQVSSSKQQRARGLWAGVNGSGEQVDVQGRNTGYTGPKLSLKDSAIKHRQF